MTDHFKEKVRAYLRLKALDSTGGKRLLAVVRHMRAISKKDIEKAKKEYPLEFANKLRIVFEKKHIKTLYEENKKANEERLERPQFIYFEIKPVGTESLGILIEEVDPYEKVVERVGEVHRSPRHFSNAKIRKFCKRFSVEESRVAYSHTHINHRALPSAPDLVNYKIGNIYFTTELNDGYFYVTIYRGDSMPRREKRTKERDVVRGRPLVEGMPFHAEMPSKEETYESYAEERTPFYRKISFYIKGTGKRFSEFIKIKERDIRKW